MEQQAERVPPATLKPAQISAAGMLARRTFDALNEYVQAADNTPSPPWKKRLANYKIPRRVDFSETELPKSGSGKILKRILRERFWVSQERAVG